MNTRAIFIDMDGTLLTSSNEISQRNAEAIDRLINQGIKVFLATGRQYEITAPYHRALKLQTPMICLNGASIHDGRTGRAIQIKPVMLDEERFHQVTEESSYNVFVHTATGLYCNRMTTEIAEWTREGRVPPCYIGNLRNVDYQDVLKYSIRTGAPSSQLSNLFKEEAAVIDWSDGFELVAHGVSKWSAIITLLRAYEIDPSEVITVGDGPNDIQMLRNSGTGVAMANADSTVKNAADFVTGHHESDGLADFIERYLVNSFAV
ncbi:Cof subfamily protein (haloacid dehalogenase superfamily) [Virgibacillus natechei]|uniref:Cof subfamily protein (Haloacid dehalogenase superfamily) n=1 Tax=Virgibacillus natechei TaxID=1216297 RepID=A0ABS4IGL0_9BACI|nr:HAD family hydrolase [Virgibacillus natechei]MBP1970065.1 Cof subfamily protein (haloacid dehalogenase superfamily) [Virgibacillus natechei]UZD14146.1 HAD family hydrolase [Virgibacillus natechei]